MNDTIYKFTVPTPPKVLRPNSIKAHRWKSQPRKMYRLVVAKLCSEQIGGEKPMLKHVRMDTTWTFKLKRGHDMNNLTCWFKAGIDALQDAGLIQDDRYLIPMPPRIVFDKTIEKDTVMVEIQEVNPEDVFRG